MVTGRFPVMDPRLARSFAEPEVTDMGIGEANVAAETGPTIADQPAADPGAELAAATEGAFRADLERIRFSPYFSRLAAVTQVISQGAAGQVVHNRLTHTIKVTAVARAIAKAVRSGPDAYMADELGGCDPVC